MSSSGGQDYSDMSLLHLFGMEAETQTALLNNGLLTLERDPQNADSLESLMRAAHSLKGAARIVQLAAAEHLAHVMEDCFVAAQEGRVVFSSDHIEVLLQGVDMLTRIGQAASTDAAQVADLDTALVGVVTAIAAITDPAAPPRAPPPPRPKPPAQAVPQDPPRPSTAPASAASPEASAPAQHEAMAAQSTPVSSQNLPTTDEDAPVAGLMPVPSPSKPVPVRDDPMAVPNVRSTSQTRPELAAPAPQEPAGTGRMVRVTADNLNRLMGLAGESLVESRWLEPFANALRQLKRSQLELADMVERLRQSLSGLDMPEALAEDAAAARRKVDECRHMLSNRLIELELFARRSENLSDRLYREAIASRMRPFDDGVQGFPRMVRDIARRLGKKVAFEIIGRATEVDRDILERLEAPLSHLLRNAIDHGIEPPEERLAAGKPEEGILRLEAAHKGGMLSITVSDDGRGIEVERLRQKVVSKQLATTDMAASLTEAELLEFLFLPAFSTKEQVTEISGRGVGLDVVHTMAHEAGGTVRAVSEPGRGMQVYLQLPLTLSVLRTLLVEIAGEPYAFPLARIDRALMVARDDIAIVADRQYFTLDGQHIGLVSAQQVLELRESTPSGDALPVIVVSDRLNCYGLVVDRFLGESDLVVQPLDARLGKVPDLSAAALMEDGSPILIIDVEDMVRSVDNLLFGRRLHKVGHATKAIAGPKRKRILVVDDSLTVREAERQLLANHGYDVEVAVDGMDGWNAVRVGHYDLVITDLDMPRMDGFELVRQIKNDSHLHALPVMIVSYKGSEEDRNRGLEAGASYYFTKSSFHDETLLQAVVDLIGGA
ncbi:MAG TPA: hybrid sensor histidine kinase/response regulator [Candidatus Tectomicrobia bacterium]|nr:hybrid sensor histidine kinase/response regulator [Candidatus Tectomicrobia bacterium]